MFSVSLEFSNNQIQLYVLSRSENGEKIISKKINNHFSDQQQFGTLLSIAMKFGEETVDFYVNDD